MAAVTAMQTAETEELGRVLAHIRDLNRAVADSVVLDAADRWGASTARQVLQRLESMPFLLASFRFADPEFWRERTIEQVASDVNAMQGPAVQFARHLLSVAWHCGRASVGARLLLGIARDAGELITRLRFAQLDALAAIHAGEVRRRWDEVPGFWQRLLETAGDGSEAQWSQFQLHALGLLGREHL